MTIMTHEITILRMSLAMRSHIIRHYFPPPHKYPPHRDLSIHWSAPCCYTTPLVYPLTTLTLINAPWVFGKLVVRNVYQGILLKKLRVESAQAPGVFFCQQDTF